MALIEFFLQKFDNSSISTFQEINDIIKLGTDHLIDYFIKNPSEQVLIEKKNPLCIEAVRDYLYRLFRGVQKKCGHDLHLFLEGLKATFKSQLSSITKSTNEAAEVGYTFMVEHNFSKFLVYNYSKSIAIMLRKLSKKIGTNLEVYTCQSSFIGEGYQSRTM